MENINLTELKELKDGKNRLLGFDIGSKNIGLSICDPQFIVATPLTLLKRKTFQNFITQLNHIVQSENIAAYIVGLPLHMTGEQGRASQSIQDFTNQICQQIPYPVYFQDERLTTVAAEKMLLSHDVTRKKREKVIDKLAATYILQTVLDKLSYES